MSRLSALRQEMADCDLIALLVTESKNVTYLSRFTGDESALLISQDKACLITDSRYVAQAHQQVTEFDLVVQDDGLLEKAASLAQNFGLTQIGFEATQISYQEYQTLKQLFPASLLVPTSDLIQRLREVKDVGEINLIKQATAITDACFDYLLNFVQVGMTELHIAAEMEYFMRSHGASGSSFETIVASGYRSAWPHGVASAKKIENHDLLTFDFGCYVQGYTSDITRTISVGQPTALSQEIYQIVLATNQSVIAHTSAGVTGGEIDQLAHQMIADAGYGSNFSHGTGHGIGLDIHEGPGPWGRYKQQALVSGNVITDEPGIYLEGIGGIRIEDDLLVQPTNVEVLTKAPKHELIVI